MNDDTQAFSKQLQATRAQLMRWLRQHASGVMRFESVDDLVQGVHLRALRARERFSWRGEDAFAAWLFTLARRHVADRHDHWSALKRGSGRVLRITYGDGGSKAGGTRAAPLPAASDPTPGSFTSRRELLVLATRALAALPERDRKLVQWSSEGVELAEQAQRLEMSYSTAQRSRLRALERFRKTFELISRGRPEA